MRKIKVYFMYACWIVANWMDNHKPYLPRFVRLLVFKYYPGAETRMVASKRTYDWWISQGHEVDKKFKPLPWPICENCFGPFIKPWNKIRNFVAKGRGGHAHRCDFTDKKNGLLYGGDGQTMNKLWGKFMETIDNDGEDA